MTAVAVIGNVSRDRIAGRIRVGGGPYYAGRALRALARRGAILTKCSEQDRRRLLTPLACLGLPVLWREAPSTAEHVPGRPVEPTVDATGAGDAFGAVYLAARAAGNGPVGAARRACALVADVLSGKQH